MKVEITIGVCARNCEKTINSAIKSIEDQVFPKQAMEIIFVDDGSIDGTLDAIKGYCSKTEISTRIFSQSWKGLGTARNIIVNNAEGRYIMWVDCDMRIGKEYVKKHVDFMDDKPWLGAAKGRFVSSQSIKHVSQLEALSRTAFRGNIRRLVGTGGSIFRVKAIREAGGFDERISGAGEDIEALTRMYKNGWTFEFVDARSCEYYKDNWKDLWRQYYSYGRGAHGVWREHGIRLPLAGNLPPLSFVLGIAHFCTSFKLYRRWIALLLPLYESFRSCAWLFGFLKSHFKKTYTSRLHLKR